MRKLCVLSALIPLGYFTLLGSTALGSQSLNIPNVLLEVTVQQRTEGELSKAFHIWELSCWQGECELTILTLNQCVPGVGTSTILGGRGSAFYPKIQRFPGVGLLKVTNLGDALDVKVQFPDDNAVMTARIGYRKERPSSNFASVVTSFSGGAVKQSAILEKVITWDLVPIKGTQRVVLDCPALVFGVSPN